MRKVHLVSLLLVTSFFCSSLAWSKEIDLQKFRGQTVRLEARFYDESSKKLPDFWSVKTVFSAKIDANGIYHIQGVEWMGVCIDPKKNECTVDADAYSLVKDLLSSGLISEENKKTYESGGKNLRVRAVTQSHFDGDSIQLKSKRELFIKGSPYLSPVIAEARISLASSLFKFAELTKVTPSTRNSDFKTFPKRVQSLAKSVVQIMGKSNESGLQDEVRAGSGFFVSDDGFLLTNYHVIHDMPSACATKMKCTLQFRQILGAGKVQEFDAAIVLMAESKAHDFALVKVDLPAGIKIQELSLEDHQAGPNVLTLGYPADREAENGIALTYATGDLYKELGTGVQFGVTGKHGDSGSPLLSGSSFKVIGIFSDGVGADGKETSAVARSMFEIEKNFQISQYVSGKKQKRVDQIIRSIKSSASSSEAQKWMSMYKSENTLYGVSDLEKALYSDLPSDVRKTILQGLQKLGIVRGPLND
jgi:S1-C subfamily serine protease